MTGDRQLPLALCLLLWAATAPAQPVVEVQISGVDGALLDNVRAHLGVAAYDRKSVLMTLPDIGADTPEEPLTEGALRRLHQRARGEILQALQPFGYYQPVIDASLKRRDGIWHAGYRIDPGPATLIGNVDIALEGFRIRSSLTVRQPSASGWNNIIRTQASSGSDTTRNTRASQR